jgi:hypothetical protein
MTKTIPAATERRSPPRRRTTAQSGPGDEGYREFELRFLLAVDSYKVQKRRPFPALMEILGVFSQLVREGKMDEWLAEMGLEKSS